MHAATSSPNTLFRTLRHSLQRCFPRFLQTAQHGLEQPLLDENEIRDLRLRIISRTQKPQPHTHDTANQRMGDIRSTHRGYGMDYEESRPYQAGDDPRLMNWALTARTGELHTKVFREERRPGVFIVVDRRTSMRFGTRTRLKVTQAARLAACIAFAAVQRHASVGGAILDAASATPHWLKETADEQTAFALINAANAPCPPTNLSSVAETQEPSFSHVLNMLQASLAPGTQLYFLSDFIDAKEQHRDQLLHLASEHPVHAIHISDPAEQHLPQIGGAQFYITAERQALSLNTQSSEVQRQYDTAANKHFTDRQQLFRNLGITYTAVSTTKNEIETVLSGL